MTGFGEADLDIENGRHFADPSGETWAPAEIKQMRAEKVLLRCASVEAACVVVCQRGAKCVGNGGDGQGA